MKIVTLGSVIVVVLALGGCMLSSSRVQVSRLAAVEKGPKVVKFLSDTPYVAEMSVALAENGFII